MPDELKPCPFCGNTNVELMPSKQHPGLFVALCRGCEASGPYELYKENVIEHWNSRPLESQITAELEKARAALEINAISSRLAYQYLNEHGELYAESPTSRSYRLGDYSGILFHSECFALGDSIVTLFRLTEITDDPAMKTGG